IVYIHMRQLDIGIFFGHVDDNIAPELRGLEHVGLIHAAQLLAAFLRRLERDMGNAPHLGFRVMHGVEALALSLEGAVFNGSDTARLTKVNITGQFTYDEY